MLSSQRAAIRSGSSRRREKAEKSTSAIGIAIRLSGRMTMLIPNVQAPSSATLASLPISSVRTSSSIKPRPATARDPDRERTQLAELRARELQRRAPAGAEPERGDERGHEDDLLQDEGPRPRPG